MGGIEVKRGPHCEWINILHGGIEAAHWGSFCLLGAFSLGDVTAGRPSLDRHLGVTLLSIQIHEQNELSLLPGLCYSALATQHEPDNTPLAEFPALKATGRKELGHWLPLRPSQAWGQGRGPKASHGHQSF